MAARLPLHLVLGLLLAGPASGQELPLPPLPDLARARSPRLASYAIRAELLDDGATIVGELDASWRNATSAPATELLWHLYCNAWSGPGSAWLSEARRHGDAELPRSWGGTEVESIHLLVGGQPGPELPHAFRPPAWAPADRTVLATALPAPAAPGATIAVRVSFRTLLPPAFRRNGIGVASGYVHAAQWFPKLGVFEDGPAGAAWNCQPYRYLTEFYADYGLYELDLTLPARYRGRVAASGDLVTEETLAGGRARYRFRAEDIHDFAWSADPAFLVREREFRAEDWTDPAEEERVARALGRSVEEIRPRPTRMLLYLQAEHADLEERYFRALGQALYSFGLWFGSYPYPTIAVVDPAHDARATGGMEYPRLITAGAHRGAHVRSLSPESVTVHEFGHQFFYGLIGTDEVHHAWMDEGLNTWATNRVLRAGWPPPPATYRLLAAEHAGLAPLALPAFPAGDLRGLLTLERWESPDLGFLPPWSAALRRSTSIDRWLRELPPFGYWSEVLTDRVQGVRQALDQEWTDALARPTADLLDSPMRRVNAYDRPALVLETLAGLVGEERWTRVLRAYAERYRFGHPRPDDFLAILLEQAGEVRIGGLPLDLRAFWRQAYHENRRLDYGVHRLANLPAVAASAPLGAAPHWDVVVELRRFGDFELPVECRVRWSDGGVERLVWDGRESWVAFRWPDSERQAVSVEIDPERRILLDADWLNDSRQAVPERARASAAALKALIWAQQVLHHAGGMG